MDEQKKCSNKKHSDINAVSYCYECKLYLCNKCTNYHIEYLDTHHNYNLEKNNQEIFTGLCNELKHGNELEFYCRTHNKLCCAACLSKIKGKGNGQHHDCDVCLIKEIEEEKKNKLKDNIIYLKESSNNIEESIKKLKLIYETINKSKEEIRIKILNIFTKIRNIINEREDKLLSDLNNIYENTYFKDDLIKKGEKLPNQIKIFLEKGEKLNKDWDDNIEKLTDRINDCINIEDNIKNIIAINENINRYNSKKVNIVFLSQDEKINEIEVNIKYCGEIINEDYYDYKFKFNPGNNYNLSNNCLIATKQNGGDKFNCVVIGDKEIPKNRISKWKIKIIKYKDKSKGNNDIYIGIGPKIFRGNLYNECWSIKSDGNSRVKLQLKKKSLNYDNHNEEIKEGDIIEVIIDRKLGNLSFALNDVNLGLACSEIPKEEELYPTIVLYEQGVSVEIV